MPRQRWEYKFIVDNNWTFSKHDPTCIDEKGNVNNFIDTKEPDIDQDLVEKNKENISPLDKHSNGCSNERKDSKKKDIELSNFHINLILIKKYFSKFFIKI